MSLVLTLRDAHVRHHMRACTGAIAMGAFLLAVELWLSVVTVRAGATADAVALVMALPAVLLAFFSATAVGARLRQRSAARREKYLSRIIAQIAANTTAHRRARAPAAGVARLAALLAGASVRVVCIAALMRAAIQADRRAALGCVEELTPKILSQRPLPARAARV